MRGPSWNRVKDVIDAALDRAPDERSRFVRETCGDDLALRSEVESLLSAMSHAENFVERPALHELLEPTRRTLRPGETIGAYEILDFIGAGGMGEVYRARDVKLNRDVALKVPSGVFAFDQDRLARFEREAQFLASLNHPNIAAIYGLEESGGIQALVLEHIEGSTLAHRLAQRRVPINEALSIAAQIARGLSAAHERGIVHRDLKPANIKLRPDGTVKVLDFGLAKAFDASDFSSSARDAGTVTSPAMSRAGAVFGTAAYMSPEQARDRGVDKRTDIWAFGCVLYETLAGRPAFLRETVEDTLAAVVGDEPDWSALPIETPTSVATLLHRCLQKDPDRRLHDIADARIEIEDAMAATPITPVSTRRSQAAFWALAGVTVVVVASAAWAALRPAGRSLEADRAVRRLQISLPKSQSLADAQFMPLGLGQPSLAISPDGARLAYVLERNGNRQLFLRAFDQVDGAPIAGTEGAFGPFFSPDGEWIGFFADNKLKKVSMSVGPIVLCDAPNPYGGSWGTDGTILFSTDEGRRPMVVPGTGGRCQGVPLQDNRGSWTQPHMLPAGKAAIVSNPLLGVGVLSLTSGEFRRLVESGFGGSYAPSGHLVFARAGSLMAAPFDLERLAVRGPATVVLDGIRMEGQVAVAQAVFSRDGTLVYAPGRAANRTTTPVWVDRQGTIVPVGMPPRTYRSFSLSPDGKRLAIVIADPNNDVWVQDLERGTLTRLTSGGNNVQPKWTRDGSRVLFTSIIDGRRTAFSVMADGSGTPEAAPWAGNSFSPKGDAVAFARASPDTGLDLWVRSLKNPETPQLFVRTPFTEVGPEFSPDGRYIAYVSDESGQYEVYVRPYPLGPGKWQISPEGGEEGIWSRDGKELFYRNGNKWMAVDVRLRPEFKVGKPRQIFEGPYVNVGGLSYDVALDGQRFLVLQPAEGDVAPVTHLNVVLNWFDDVRRKTAVH